MSILIKSAEEMAKKIAADCMETRGVGLITYQAVNVSAATALIEADRKETLEEVLTVIGRKKLDYKIKADQLERDDIESSVRCEVRARTCADLIDEIMQLAREKGIDL